MVICADGCAYGYRIVLFTPWNDGASGTGIRERIAAFQDIHAVPYLRHTVIEPTSQD